MSDLLQTIKKAVENLVTLEIKTVVGPIDFAPNEKNPTDLIPIISAENAKNQKAIITKFDLLQGDITTQMDQEFVTGDLQSLKAYHEAKEAQGFKIIKDNIEALKSLVSYVNTEIQGIKSDSTPSSES